MKWVYANDGTPHNGDVHNFRGITYSGATRTRDSRRLVPAAEDTIPDPSPKPKPRRKSPPRVPINERRLKMAKDKYKE